MSELSQKGENIYQTHILPNLSVAWFREIRPFPKQRKFKL